VNEDHALLAVQFPQFTFLTSVCDSGLLYPELVLSSTPAFSCHSLYFRPCLYLFQDWLLHLLPHWLTKVLLGSTT